MLAVHQLYNDVLHRNADPDGARAYRRHCRHSRAEVEDILRASSEYKGRVASFYKYNGVSVCCAIKNRWEMLRESLPTWLACDDIQDVVIVDYGSAVPVHSALSDEGIDDERIRVVQVLHVDSWCLSKAYNIAFSHARCNCIAKMDTDYRLLNTSFFKDHPLRRGIFYSGNWRNSRDENEDHLNGFVYMYKHDFFRVNGYSEHIVTYGRDDEDLYERLRLAAVERRDIAHDCLHHIPHGDDLRTRHQRMNTDNCHDEIIYNEGVKIWTESDYRDCHHTLQARGNLWYSSVRPFFIFRAHHGLGNRLRALMSVLQYVEKYNMELVMQWPIDHHMGCSFNALFLDAIPLMDPTMNVPFDLGGDKYDYVDDDPDNNKGELVVFLDRPIFAKSNCVLNFEGMDYPAMSRLLRGLTPLGEISARVPRFTSYTVGVHIRMDSAMTSSWEAASNYSAENYTTTQRERARSHYSNFVAEMLRIEETTCCKWFVCTDSPHIIPRMRQIFGSSLIVNRPRGTARSTVVNREGVDIQDAFVDMLSLSRCNALLGSSWSSFTEVAQYLRDGPYDFMRIVGQDQGAAR